MITTDDRRDRLKTLQVAEIDAEVIDLCSMLSPLSAEAGRRMIPEEVRADIIAWLKRTSGEAQKFADTLDYWNRAESGR